MEDRDFVENLSPKPRFAAANLTWMEMISVRAAAATWNQMK